MYLKISFTTSGRNSPDPIPFSHSSDPIPGPFHLAPARSFSRRQAGPACLAVPFPCSSSSPYTKSPKPGRHLCTCGAPNPPQFAPFLYQKMCKFNSLVRADPVPAVGAANLAWNRRSALELPRIPSLVLVAQSSSTSIKWRPVHLSIPLCLSPIFLLLSRLDLVVFCILKPLGEACIAASSAVVKASPATSHSAQCSSSPRRSSTAEPRRRRHHFFLSPPAAPSYRAAKTMSTIFAAPFSFFRCPHQPSPWHVVPMSTATRAAVAVLLMWRRHVTATSAHLPTWQFTWLLAWHFRFSIRKTIRLKSFFPC